MQGLQRTVQRRVLRYFCRHDLLDEHTTTDMLAWQGTGGFSIDASVRIEGHDRHGIERLVRYCARPPFALHRLHALGGNASLTLPDAHLLYRLPGPTPDAPAALRLTPLDLLQRRSRLVPPPRIHRHRYHGVLARGTHRRWVARLRPQVIGLGRSEPIDDAETAPVEQPLQRARTDLPHTTTSSRSSTRIRWAQLLARIYEVLPLLCPSCGGEMRVLAFLTDPPVVQTILVHLELPHRPPPITPARSPPQGDLLLDQTPGFHLTEPDPVPEPQFDQSMPDAFDA